MNLFYSTNINDETIVFENQELQHLKVLRQELGNMLNVMDGKGNLYEAELIEINKKYATAKVVKKEYQQNKRTYYLHLAIAPTKNNDRIEFFLEKAIELGVDEISFIKTERTEKKNLKPERMQKILLSACKQSKCYHFPKLNFQIDYKQIVKHTEQENKYICHCLEKNDLQPKQNLNQGSFLILVGPEGDFSPKEIKQALENHFLPMDLGESRLRTETAGIYVCATFRNNILR